MQPILDLHAVSLSSAQIPFSPLDEPLSATASSPTLISALPDPSAPQLPLSQPPGTPLCYGAFPYTHASPSSSSTDESISPTTPTRHLRRQPSPLSPSRDDDGLVLRGTSFVHPYARLYSKRQGAGKRRKMWNHTLEKLLFSPQEISSMSAPKRRTIYTASLEAHIDRLHEQLASCERPPATKEQLLPYHGLNVKTVKSMVSGLHHDGVEIKLKLLELERAIKSLEQQLDTPPKHY